MRVLLLNPGGGYAHEYPPLGLLYIASALRTTGHTVAFFDCGAQSAKSGTIDEASARFVPEACGIALYTTNLFDSYAAIEKIKKDFPSCIIFVGGPHATALPEFTMSECRAIDYLVCGEGEQTSKELLDALKDGSDPSLVPGLYYRDGDHIISSGKREMIRDLDSIPFPAYDLIAGFHYTYDAIRIGMKIATVITSRGCPYDCVFCAAKAVWKSGFRRRSPANVVDEIVMLQREYGYDEIYFVDDLFAVNRQWLEEFYGLLKNKGLAIRWKCLARVDTLTFSDYRQMAENGCYVIQFGVESGDNRILKDIRKNINTFQIARAFSQARIAGLNTYGFFIVGHRLDTYETVMKTINFAASLSPDFVSFFSMVPFPGTDVYRFVPDDQKYSWDRIAYSGWTRGKPQIQLSKVAPEDLLAFEEQAQDHIYSSLGYLLKNIIFSRARVGLRAYKIRRAVSTALHRIKAVLSGRWIIGRYSRLDLTGLMDTQAFDSVWKAFRQETDFLQETKAHLAERQTFLDLIEKYVRLSCAREVLETGCGTAIDAHYIARKFPGVKVVATDALDGAVTIAKRIGELMGSTADVSVDDVQASRFESGKFDIVFSQGLMEHFKDPLPMFREQVRILKPGGFLIVSVPQKFNPYTSFKHCRIREGIWEYGWEKEYSLAELKRFGDICGLTTVEAAGYGYGYMQDYGFSLPAFAIRWVGASHLPVIRQLGRLAGIALSMLERAFGAYFMQNIASIYRKPL